MSVEKAVFFAESALDDTRRTFDEIEKTTMHPYIKYQKARILQMIQQSGYVAEDFSSDQINAFKEAIWIIKTNPQFNIIQQTKSYASVLWLLGYQLIQIDETNNRLEAEKYFEDSKEAFENLKIRDKEYYQCVSHMARNCLENVSYTHIRAHETVLELVCRLLREKKKKIN